MWLKEANPNAKIIRKHSTYVMEKRITLSFRELTCRNTFLCPPRSCKGALGRRGCARGCYWGSAREQAMGNLIREASEHGTLPWPWLSMAEVPVRRQDSLFCLLPS